ncbi:hypothetical protein ABMA27_010648 [Loxostege sticticalis]|uniref:Uncharacterized protein n=1 Tax=Loxostege sticticalis TaxID=481309 RepID=A0ABR3H3V8_LOXSC
MEESIKKLNVNRGYIKGTLTRLYTFACNEQDVETSSLETIIAKRDRLVTSFNEYESYNKEILLLNSSDNENIQDIENKYFHCLTVFNAKINLLSSSSKEQKSPEQGSSGISRTKLPNINIPSFAGQYSQYVTFIETFKSVFHNDKALDNIQKLYYLRSFLIGEPYDLIKNLPLIGESYEEALLLLKKRYFNKYRITAEHVNCLLDVEKLPKFASSKNIRDFVSVVRQNLVALKNLDVPVKGWDAILLAILTRKLDSYSARAYQLDRAQDKDPTIEEFLDYMEKRALSLENTSSEHPVQADMKQKPGTAGKSKVALAAATKGPMECLFWPKLTPWYHSGGSKL